MNYLVRLRAFLLVCCAVSSGISTVRAHDPGLSALTLARSNSALLATITLARADAEALALLDTDRDGRVADAEFARARPELELAATDAVLLLADGTNIGPTSVAALMGHNDEVSLHVSFPAPASSRLEVRSALLAGLARGHRQYAVVRDSKGAVLTEKMLDANRPAFEASFPADASGEPTPGRAGSFGEFLLLGVEHIATGYDHLLFLLGLLIVGGGFRVSLKIITAFTVAHSLTLALATLDLIRLPASVVEPLIAASIVYVGAENIVRREWNGRWVLAFVFGLIHGCGFASVLRELGIGATGAGALAPLLSFNLGVELGQVAIAAIVLPLIWKLKERPSFQPRFVPAGSALVAMAGGYWLVERVLPLVWH